MVEGSAPGKATSAKRGLVWRQGLRLMRAESCSNLGFLGDLVRESLQDNIEQ